MSPKLAWIAKEKIRAGYNYNAPLEMYPIAKQCGMNAIFSRLEIANDPSGDVELRGTLAPDARRPDALRSYELVRPSSRLAKQLGLHWFYMLDLAASWGNYSDGIRDNPRRHNNGKLFAPADEIYWTRVVENRFLRVAEMLRGDEFQIDGFLIDPEMYSLGGATPPGLDFGDYAMEELCKAKRLQFDFRELSIQERRQRIEDQGLTEQLQAFQFERIEALARRTRERVQAIHPDAIFGFFLWRPSFWFQAIAAGFSTPRTPCLVGPEATYSGVYDEHFLTYQDFVRQEAGVPVLFVPGLALSADDGPEMLGAFRGNLYHRSIRTQGYWFWALSRAFGNVEKRQPVVDMLGIVNAELDRRSAAEGEYESSLWPTALPAGTPGHLQDTLLSARSWAPVPREALPVDAPAPTPMQLRGPHTFVLRVAEGEQATFDVRNIRLGQYFSPTSVKAFRPDASEIAFDTVPLNQSRRIVVNADKTGDWVLVVTSGETVGNAFGIRTDAPKAVLYSPGGSVSGCKGGNAVFRYFFYVPKGTETFRLRMAGSGAETATFRLFGPGGEQLLEEKDLGQSVEREIDAVPLARRVCWLETTDIVEDHSFGLVGIPSIFAWQPGQLLVPEL